MVVLEQRRHVRHREGGAPGAARQAVGPDRRRQAARDGHGFPADGIVAGHAFVHGRAERPPVGDDVLELHGAAGLEPGVGDHLLPQMGEIGRVLDGEDALVQDAVVGGGHGGAVGLGRHRADDPDLLQVGIVGLEPLAPAAERHGVVQ